MSDIDLLADTQESNPRPDLTRVQPPRTAKQIEIRKMRSTHKYKDGVAKFRKRMSQMRGGQGAPCHLCGQDIMYALRFPHPGSFSVDHVISAEERPDLFFDMNNWAASHFTCNSARGGMDEDVFGPGALGQASEVW
jgi:5-methylcytosine-specific restriction endonuclease McrA